MIERATRALCSSFIYPPPRTVDEVPSSLGVRPGRRHGQHGRRAAPSRAPPLDSRDQNRSRGVPAFQGDGAAINCHGRTPSQARGVARRSTDGRCGRVYWWRAFDRRAAGCVRGSGVDLERAAPRYGSIKHHGLEDTASQRGQPAAACVCGARRSVLGERRARTLGW